MYSFEEIYQAYLECRLHKRNSINSLKFELHLIENLWELFYAINSLNYKPKRYIHFLTSSPKLREVFASDFRDRVVHHLLVRDLEPIFEPLFIYDSYSCRKSKGTHLAINRLKRFVQNQNYPYYLQLDIQSFFLSINKNILFEKICSTVSKREPLLFKRIQYLSRKIIFDDPTQNYIHKGNQKDMKRVPSHKSLFSQPKNRGLPIGNLTSQFFANVYLNDFDNFIKRELKVRYYFRYVDDTVIFGKSKEELFKIKDKIEEYLQKNLYLNLRNDYSLTKTSNGINFLGYVVKSTHTLVRQRVVNNFKYKKAKFFKESFRKDFINENGVVYDGLSCSDEEAKKFKMINASYYGHFKHADSFQLIKKYEMKNWLKLKI